MKKNKVKIKIKISFNIMTKKEILSSNCNTNLIYVNLLTKIYWSPWALYHCKAALFLEDLKVIKNGEISGE